MNPQRAGIPLLLSGPLSAFAVLLASGGAGRMKKNPTALNRRGYALAPLANGCRASHAARLGCFTRGWLVAVGDEPMPAQRR